MILKKLDFNGDGKVTRADLVALVNKQLEHVPAKYRAQYQQHIDAQIDKMWKKWDKNGDGEFSRKEAIEFIKAMMTRHRGLAEVEQTAESMVFDSANMDEILAEVEEEEER